mmetsp:Transcript_122295/g.328556  ORF Transcript_122295/g.328556 Transcript_122295/m.328556 type:complete len:109 (+) Transcript_122295:113-439(+)
MAPPARAPPGPQATRGGGKRTGRRKEEEEEEDEAKGSPEPFGEPPHSSAIAERSAATLAPAGPHAVALQRASERVPLEHVACPSVALGPLRGTGAPSGCGTVVSWRPV